MKENWTYKKLGEVAEIYQPKTLSTEMLIPNGKYLVYGANGVIGRYNEYNHKERELLVTCRGATCGIINVSEPESWVNGNAMVVHSNTSTLNFDYLKYTLHSVDWSLVITGAAQPQITRQKLSPVIIPIPPLSKQQSIVRELDLLNDLIAKKRAQVAEYDQLQQSLFYTMFGDPVTNEKGWEKVQLSDVCDVRDGTHDSPTYLQDSDYVLITSKNIKNGEIDFKASINYISKEDYDAINKRSRVDVGDIIMPMIGTIGNPIIVKASSIKYCIKNVALIKFAEADRVVNMYIKNVIDNPSYMCYLLGLNKGGTQKFVALGSIRKLSLPLPPLPLQQEFAKKVEAIEALKEKVNASIKETETLLAARMDYYFG